jgi:hypothetical protein
MISQPLIDSLGVNQGGNASPALFIKYLSDLGNYLSMKNGICIGDIIMVHLLWADDLVLISDSPKGLQSQLDGLFKFCSKNLMILNELKTKTMYFGNCQPVEVYFNGKAISNVNTYKYLGNVFSSTRKTTQDIFTVNYSYLCDQSRKATFSLQRSTKQIGKLSPNIMFHLFNSLIRPILLYGSEVWGVSKRGTDIIDKVCLRFIRNTLGIKCTTSNIITLGESGQMPPSVFIDINVLCFAERLKRLSTCRLAKKVYDILDTLHNNGFNTWTTYMYKLRTKYSIQDDTSTLSEPAFKKLCKETVFSSYKRRWESELNDVEKNPIVRTYSLIKSEFQCEKYLSSVSNNKCRNALCKLRTGSHTLEIERGRHLRPIIPRTERLCNICNLIEDEFHFVTKCRLYNDERAILYAKIISLIPDFLLMSDMEKFTTMLTSNNEHLLSIVAKFIYKSFLKRKCHME